MFQTIGEKVAVIGVYQNSRFVPKKFLWRNSIIRVEMITLISDIRDGMVRKRIYSVLSQQTLYRLLFNRETEIWTLEETWHT